MRVKGIPVLLFVIPLLIGGVAAFLPDQYMLLGTMIVPVLGTLIHTMLPRRARGKTWGLGVSFSTAIMGLSLALRFDWAAGGMQFVYRGWRLDDFGIQFALGVDTVSLLLV